MKAQEEVDRVLQGRPPSYDDVKELKFVTRCLTESLRLYPHPPVSCSPFPHELIYMQTIRKSKRMLYIYFFFSFHKSNFCNRSWGCSN